MITVYNQFETNFNNNGYGVLRDVISAQIIEELNGQYELELEYPSNGYLADKIVEGNILKAKSVESYQLFRIKHVSKDLKRKSIVATHIFYDLNDDFLEDTYPQNLNGQAALQWILDHTANENPQNFAAYSDITRIATARYVRRNPVEALIGDIENSFVKVWNGELERDNFTIKVLNKRGNDTGYKIIKTKNLTAIRVDVNYLYLITRIMPQGFNGLLLPEKYIDSELIDSYPHPIIKKVEFPEVQVIQDDENPENNVTEEEAFELLREKAAKLYSESHVDEPTVSISVEFVELSKTKEYKEKYSFLESVKLGDTLYTQVDDIDVDISIRVVKYTWDVLKERYISLELGSVKSNYVTSQIAEEQENNESWERVPNLLQQVKNFATSSITNAMGGYVYKTQSELFIMDTPDPTTAEKVWRWNLEGLGYSSTGIEGPYELAMTAAGQIVADFISTGTLDANLMTTGVLRSQDGNFYINLNTGEFYSIDVEGIRLQVSENKDNIETNQQRIAAIDVLVDRISESIQISGGNNAVINSVGIYGTDRYEITGTGNSLFGEVADLVNVTKSGAMIYATNLKIKHEEIVLVEGNKYTLTFRYSNTAGNRFKFTLKNTTEIELVNTTAAKNLEEVVYTFVASGNVTYTMECSYVDNTKGGFLTDLILIDGDLRSNWEPAPGEIMGTALQLYYNGIKVISDNSNIITTINNLGMSVVDRYNANNIILTLNNLRVLLTNTEIKGTLKIENFLLQQLTINSDECLFIL